MLIPRYDVSKWTKSSSSRHVVDRDRREKVIETNGIDNLYDIGQKHESGKADESEWIKT